MISSILTNILDRRIVFTTHLLSELLYVYSINCASSQFSDVCISDIQYPQT